MVLPFLGALAAGGIGAGLGLGTKGGRNFLFGSPEKRKNVSTLRPEQEQLYQQLVQSGMQPGAGGAFGGAADYYRGLLGDNSADMNAFSAPALRQYNQDIMPGISEQFAGMGFGGSGLNSSGFRNAQVQGATDLAERLGAMRANLRMQGAQGLANIGGLGLQNFSQNMVTKQGSPGFLGSVAPAIGGAIGTAVGGPVGGFLGSGLGSAFGNATSTSGYRAGSNQMPDWQSMPASPQIPQRQALPNFSYGRG